MPKNFKHVFVQDCGFFPDEILVVVGMEYKDVMKKVKSLRLKKDMIECLEHNQEHFRFGLEDGRFLAFEHTDKGIRRYAMFLESWNRTKEDTCILIHEIVHAMQGIMGKGRGADLMDEAESAAYFVEYLYSNIMSELDRVWYAKPKQKRKKTKKK